MLRRGFQVLLLLLLLLLVPLSVTGIWVRQVIVDQATFVRTLEGVPGDPAVQDEIVRIVGDATSSRLPAAWETFVTSTVSSPTIRSQLLAQNPDVRGFVEAQTRTVLQDSSFTPIWVSILESAHPMVLSLVRDTGFAGDDGAIVLNVSPVYNALVAQLATQGIDVTKVLPEAVDDLTLTVYQPSSMQQVERIGRLIDRWAIPLGVIAALVGVLVVLISRRKALAGAVVGLTVLVSAAISLVALTVVVGRVLDRQLEPNQRDAALAIVRELTTVLREWLLWVGIVGAAVMVVCLVAQFILRRSPSAPSYR